MSKNPTAMGALEMKVPFKAAMVVCVVTIAVLGFRLLHSGEELDRPTNELQPGDRSVVTYESPDESPAPPVGGASRREIAHYPPATETLSEDEDAAVAPRIGYVEARIVDEQGQGLVGAQLSASLLPYDAQQKATTFEAVSEPSGAVYMQVRLHSRSSRVSLTAVLHGWAEQQTEVRVDAGETTFIGDIVLLPTSSVSGVVVDKHGLAVEGAGVIISTPSESPGEIPQLRLTGPRRLPDSRFSISAADGRFRIEGVAIGSCFLWAGAEGFLWASIGPLQIKEGEDLSGLEVVLERRQEEDRIFGVVLSPDGEAVWGAEVQAEASSATGNTVWTTQTDKEGRFEVLLAPGSTVDICVTDTKGRWSDLYAFSLVPAGHELTLEFRAARRVAVSAVDYDGQPVDEFGVTLEYADDQWVWFSYGHLLVQAHDAIARVLVPAREFRLVVDAPGFALESSEVYTPEDVPDRIEVRLKALPAVRGRVVAGGGPVAGAVVTPGRLLGKNDYCAQDGLQVLYQWSHASATLTESDGSFEIGLRETGQFFLRVKHEEFAPSLVGPFGPDVEWRGIEIILGPGGELEGRLVVPSGERAAGRLIGINCGDGAPRTARVDANGHYRFEKLTPGKWQVRPADSEIMPDRMIVVRSRPGSSKLRPPISWECEVFEGRTTRYDVLLENN